MQLSGFSVLIKHRKTYMNTINILVTLLSPIHTTDATQLDSCVALAVCIGYYCMDASDSLTIYVANCGFINEF